MPSFEQDGLPVRVVFGAGRRRQLRDEVVRLGIRRALLITTPSKRVEAEALRALLRGRTAGLFDGVVMHVPIEVAQAGRAEARRLDADGCVAIGGGSAIGLAKAIALELDLPIIAVPTTYAGSEMTAIQGLTENGVKRTYTDPRMLPSTVIYDPELTVTMPPAIAGPSGMNGLAHCVEAFYAERRSPLLSLAAEEGIRALARGLPRVVDHPTDLDASADVLYGAWLAGVALNAGVALHHKICHTLGGSFGLPHAPTHTVMLPYAAHYNRDAAPEAMARIARALGTTDAATGLFDLARRIGAPASLEALGMRHDDLDRAAELSTAAPYPNPRPVTREDIRTLLQAAFEGGRPPALQSA
ncbi:MAG: maleylacetate reductase [Pseudomonadota bacterium]